MQTYQFLSENILIVCIYRFAVVLYFIVLRDQCNICIRTVPCPAITTVHPSSIGMLYLHPFTTVPPEDVSLKSPHVQHSIQVASIAMCSSASSEPIRIKVVRYVFDVYKTPNIYTCPPFGCQQSLPSVANLIYSPLEPNAV